MWFNKVIKPLSDGACFIVAGRLFHNLGATAEKGLSPYVVVFIPVIKQ